MAKIKITCPHCHRLLQCDDEWCGRKLKCPHCRRSFRVQRAVPPREKPVAPPFPRRKITRLAGTLLAALFLAVAGAGLLWWSVPAQIHWPDRRPIGALFLASHYHSSATNPRGWFNNPGLDVTGTNGLENFRQALFAYTDRSLEILRRTGAQGVLVWDLEGEQFPHKTTFIGDPRLVERLAPEMAPVVDEFFARLRHAGLRVGVTIRPQQIVFDQGGVPRQTPAWNIQQVLLAKIDYARKRWGATLFYIDSNAGFWRPDELWQLREVAAQRPDVLLIPEHHYLPYWGFSAPYVALRKNDAPTTPRWARRLFPHSFQVLDISDAAEEWPAITAGRLDGNILLFRAWTWGPAGRLLEKFANEEP
jgi:hypothetical protein